MFSTFCVIQRGNPRSGASQRFLAILYVSPSPYSNMCADGSNGRTRPIRGCPFACPKLRSQRSR